VPYGWQPKGKHCGILSQKSATTNVFGLLSKENDFEAYAINASMNAQCLSAFIDDFATRIKQPTVLVLDNAPFHHSDHMKKKYSAMERGRLIYLVSTNL